MSAVLEPSLSSLISPGDEIVLINGRDLGEPLCSAQPWSNAGVNLAEITLQTKGERRTVRLALKPMSEYVEMRWRSRVSIREVSYEEERNPALTLPYTFGLRVQQQSDWLRVLDTLQGGPTDKAGIRAGDLVRVVPRESASATRELESGTWAPLALRLEVRARDGSFRFLLIKSEAWSQVLSAPFDPLSPVQVISQKPWLVQ